MRQRPSRGRVRYVVHKRDPRPVATTSLARFGRGQPICQFELQLPPSVSRRRSCGWCCLQGLTISLTLLSERVAVGAARWRLALARYAISRLDLVSATISRFNSESWATADTIRSSDIGCNESAALANPRPTRMSNERRLRQASGTVSRVHKRVEHGQSQESGSCETGGRSRGWSLG